MPSAGDILVALDPNLCTIQTCSLDYATVRYVPSLGGNAFYLALFATILAVQLALGIRYRLWGYLVAMTGGLTLEVIGYVSRLQMHANPWLSNPFLLNIIGLTIAPCFLSAAIYLCLSRIIVVYGAERARFRPRTYTAIFIGCDLGSLILQAVGGAIADTADDAATSQTGVNIMIAGLAAQVVSLTLFIALCADYARQVRRFRAQRAPLPVELSKARARFFLFALGTATISIYIRSCFRVAELQGGFRGALANNEVQFMVWEGGMVSVAAVALTVAHPGTVFGRGWRWAQAPAGADGKA